MEPIEFTRADRLEAAAKLRVLNCFTPKENVARLKMTHYSLCASIAARLLDANLSINETRRLARVAAILNYWYWRLDEIERKKRDAKLEASLAQI